MCVCVCVCVIATDRTGSIPGSTLRFFPVENYCMLRTDWVLMSMFICVIQCNLLSFKALGFISLVIVGVKLNKLFYANAFDDVGKSITFIPS